MKVLFLKDSAETNATINKMVNNLFPKIKLIEVNGQQNLMDFMINGGPFSFVVFCFDNKENNPSELYDSIIDIIGMRPFIFIGSPRSCEETSIDDVINRSSINFLVQTPLVEDEFKIPLGQAIAWVEQEEFEESIQEMDPEDLYPMRIRNFYLFDQFAFDVFLELTGNKYSKVLHKNRPYTEKAISNLVKKNVKILYIKKNDHIKFLTNSIRNLLKYFTSKNQDKSKIETIHLQSIFFIHQFIKTLGVSEEVVSLSHQLIDSIIDTYKHGFKLGNMLDTVCGQAQMTFAEQAMATIFVCDAILKEMGWIADMPRDKLFICAILQDISLHNDELVKIRSLNDPKLKMLPEEDQITFAKHPQRAAQVANLFSGFSDVDFILLEHHEHPAGEGFPKGLNYSNLTTISCVFIIAANYVARIAVNYDNIDIYKKNYEGMKRSYTARNFKDPFTALGKALKAK